MGVQLPDDRYIPLRADDLLDTLVDETTEDAAGAQQLRAVAQGLEQVVSQEIEALRRELDRRYDPYNPARDTLSFGDASDADDERIAALRTRLGYVLDKANYESLDDVQVEAAVGAASSHGIRIRVNPERIEWLELWVRGRTTAKRAVRSLRRPIKGQEHDVELYRRLAVVFRAKGDPAINLKLFREIPVADVEALLPHAEVAMGSLDRLKVVGGSLGAMGGLVARMFETTVAATQFLWLAVAGLGALSIRSFLGFRRAKHVRLSQMTHHLYYQNVANNAGVLDRMVGAIGQEELKESLLAYVLLRDPTVDSVEALRTEAARWLAEHCGVAVDFDAIDAVTTLDRFELWEDREGFSVLAPKPAAERLAEVWQQRRTAGFHVEQSGG